MPPDPTITFERLERVHLPLLQRWLAEPHVARWWNHDPSPDAVESDFGPTIDGEEPAKDYIAFVDGEPFGVIQFARFADYPEYEDELRDVYPVGPGAASIDYLIGEPALVGHGLGTAMVDAFVERIWQHEPDVTHLVVPVHSANEASWRALLRAGFRRVAQGELEPDNPVDDRNHEVLRRDR